MVSMTIINKVTYAFASYPCYKSSFWYRSCETFNQNFFTIKPHNHVKKPRITNFLSEKFKLSLKRFLTAISVIYVILELIIIINRELSCQLTDLIFGWDQSDYATGNHIFYLLFIQFLTKTAWMSFDVSSKIHTPKKYYTLSCSNHFYFHSSHWI